MTEENTLLKVARFVLRRVDAHGYTGQKRDKLTYDVWMGAFVGLSAVGHEDADWVGQVGTILIATRGYKELLQVISRAEATLAETVEVAA